MPDRSCAYPTETYGAILRICLTSISTEFQSLSTSLNFYRVLWADGDAVPAFVVDIDIDHSGSILELIQIVGHALGDFAAQGHLCIVPQRFDIGDGGDRAARAGEAAATGG